MSISTGIVLAYMSPTFVDRVYVAIRVSFCDERESKYVFR